MNKHLNTKNIVSDFLNDQLTAHERKLFLKLYSSILSEDRVGADHVFDEIQEQIDVLSEKDLQLFFKKLKAFEKSSKSLVQSRVETYLKYAAGIILVVSFGYLLSLSFFNPIGSKSYLAKVDQLIQLPDSSSVFLKAGSTLSFNSSYNQAIRQVTLEGEAFFEVKPNKEKAFIVKSQSGFYTRVLGTSFLMSTNNDVNKVEVKTGKVQVGNSEEAFAVLLAGDTLLNVQGEDILIKRHEIITESELVEFNNADLSFVIAELVAQYGTKIIVDKEVPLGLKCTATFSKDQSLEQIVKTLCELYQLKYEIKANEIFLYK